MANVANPVDRRSGGDVLSQKAIEHIQRIIVQDNLRPEQMLEPEAKLCERLGLSRAVVRDAVRHLVARGVLRTERGKGTFVCEPALTPALDEIKLLVHWDRMWLRELTELRAVLEIGIADMVVERVKSEHLERMSAAIFGARERLDNGIFDLRAEDCEFHLAYLAGAGNRAIEGYGVVLRRYFAENEKAPVDRSQSAVERTIDEHLRIQEYIVRRSVDKLKALLHLHLTRRMDTYLLQPSQA